MNTINRGFIRLTAAASVALTVAGAAHAFDLRSWDQKIDDASKRFVVLASFNNQAVLDKETQLVWERSPVPYMAGARYSAALSCALRNIAGRRGWRLPYLNELTSLADPAKPNFTLALPSGHPFQSVQKAAYWTVTKNPDFELSGYVVNFNLGGTPVNVSSDTGAYFWCVRSGMPANP